MNHHPEQRVTVNALDALSKTGRTHNDTKVKEVEATDAKSDAEFVKRARALIFIGNDDDLYQQIKAKEHVISASFFRTLLPCRNNRFSIG